MEKTYTFHPPKRAGTIFHVVVISMLIVILAFSLFRIAYAEVGPSFLTYLVSILLAIAVVPLLAYRLNSLHNAVYKMERDSIRFQWGLRVEVIPTGTILWVQPASDLAEPLRYPWIRWPGSVLGTRQLGGKTPIEFLASRSQDLVLVATYERVFAISPENPAAFIHAYQRLTELGSLVSPPAQSIHPTTIFAGVWRTPSSRNLLLISVLFVMLLVVWTILAAPTRRVISLGFLPTGEPREPIPGVRLMLIPLLNTMFWVFNFFVGLLLSRNQTYRPLANLLWGNSVFVTALFLVATYAILRIS